MCKERYLSLAGNNCTFAQGCSTCCPTLLKGGGMSCFAGPTLSVLTPKTQKN